MGLPWVRWEGHSESPGSDMSVTVPRPLYLPVRVLITAESFSLSSNIVMDTSTFLLR